jgi:hypothetical protein
MRCERIDREPQRADARSDEAALGPGENPLARSAAAGGTKWRR